MRTTRTHPRGITLIEAIAAIVVASIALPSMLWAMQGAHVTRGSAYGTRARWLAAEKLEDIIADRHSVSRGYSYIVAGNYPFEGNVAGFENFSRTVTITETGVSLSGEGFGVQGGGGQRRLD